MNFPVFSQLAGNFPPSETSSLVTAPSSGRSTNFSVPLDEGVFEPPDLLQRLADPLLLLSDLIQCRHSVPL